MTNKPNVKLVGQDGNIFNLVSIASRALKYAGLRNEAKEMQDRVFKSASYADAIAIILEYVDESSDIDIEDDEDDVEEYDCEDCGAPIDREEYEDYGHLCKECYSAEYGED